MRDCVFLPSAGKIERSLLIGLLALGFVACQDDPTQPSVPLPAAGLELATTSTSGTSTISSNFNGTAIPAGRTIWFNAVVKTTGVPTAGATLKFTASTIQFTANGQSYNLAVPNATITYAAGATQATTTFNPGTNSWETTVPLSYTGEVFLSGLAYAAPATGLPGGINPVSWAGAFSSTTTGLTASWKWAAAVYTTFGQDNNSLGVKPIEGSTQNPYANSDHAGAPENFKSYVTGGARGGGGSNYTGGYSGTANITVAVASAGHPLYVANIGNNSVRIFASGASGNVTPTATIEGGNTGLDQPAGIAFDGAGKLYVANYFNNTVTIYAPGATGDVSPTAIIAGANTGLANPIGIAFDAAGRLYVANGATASITVYAANATGDVSPLATIGGSNTGLSPTGLAFDATGNLYVGNNNWANSVTVYPPGADGNVIPIRTISGSNTGFDNATGVAFDASGMLYVGSQYGNNIGTFPPGADGNVSPTTTVSGGNTGLNGPFLLAFDSAGKLYVANGAGSSITVYAAGASGDATPIAIISGDNTGLSNPYGVAVAP